MTTGRQPISFLDSQVTRRTTKRNIVLVFSKVNDGVRDCCSGLAAECPA